MNEDRALGVVLEVAEERDAAGVAAEARRARRALAAGRFNVAVIGQFKRGKSSLVNALLGRPLLPVDIAPVTSAVTIVEHGDVESARVLLVDGTREAIAVEALPGFVAQEGNPGNARRLEAAVVTLPSPLLAAGVRLVDTPGVGSVFAPNSEETRRWLPRIDVALVVLGYDPPVTGEELALIKEALPNAGRTALVLNKTDQVEAGARERSLAFTLRVLGEALGTPPATVFRTSAKSALEGGRDPGVEGLAAWLRDLAAGSAAELSRGSARRAARALGARLLQDIGLQRRALTAPIETLDRQIESFLEATRDLGDLLLAALIRIEHEHGAAWREFEEGRDERARAATARAGAAVAAALRDDGPRTRRAMREAARCAARSAVEDAVAEFRRYAIREFERYRDHRREAAANAVNALVHRVGAAARDAFGMEIESFEAGDVDIDLDAGSFEFREPVLALDVSECLLPLLDALLPRTLVARRLEGATRALVAEWLRVNLHEVDRHLTEWLDVLNRTIETHARSRLASLQDEVLHAVGLGRAAQQQGRAAVEHALEKLASQQRRLAAAGLAPEVDPGA